MTKRILLGALAVFVGWSVLDFVMHGLILTDAYAATAHLWRPMDEMKMGLLRFNGPRFKPDLRGHVWSLRFR